MTEPVPPQAKEKDTASEVEPTRPAPRLVNHHPPRPLIVDVLIGIAIWAVVVAMALYAPWTKIWRNFDQVPRAFQFGFAGLLPIVAIILFRVREAAPRVYGSVEIIVGGLAACAGLMSGSSSDFEHGLKLVGGIYLMVRGFDNYINGYQRLLDRRAKPRQG